jgi:hypothetical protein
MADNQTLFDELDAVTKDYEKKLKEAKKAKIKEYAETHGWKMKFDSKLKEQLQEELNQIEKDNEEERTKAMEEVQKKYK